MHIKVYLHPILPNETVFPTFSYSFIKIKYRKPKYTEYKYAKEADL